MLGIKHKKVLSFTEDDTAIDIIKLPKCGDDQLYVWIQYGPTEGGLDIEKLKIYIKEDIEKMIQFMETGTNLSPSELFNMYNS